MILVLDTPEKFRAVWEALNQFVDNGVERDDSDPVPPVERAATGLIEEFDATVVALAEV